MNCKWLNIKRRSIDILCLWYIGVDSTWFELQHALTNLDEAQAICSSWRRLMHWYSDILEVQIHCGDTVLCMCSIVQHRFFYNMHSTGRPMDKVLYHCESGIMLNCQTIVWSIIKQPAGCSEWACCVCVCHLMNFMSRFLPLYCAQCCAYDPEHLTLQPITRQTDGYA